MTIGESTYSYLGKGHKLFEGQEKVSGRVKFTADLKLAGMLYVRPVLSPHAHASIVSCNLTAARLVPGVVSVLTAAEVAVLRFTNSHGFFLKPVRPIHSRFHKKKSTLRALRLRNHRTEAVDLCLAALQHKRTLALSTPIKAN